MPSLCFIRFNESPIGVYNSGQLISGVVDLTTDKIKDIRGIFITVRGYASVQWTESESVSTSEGRSESRTVYYSAHDEYFASRTDVMSSGDGSRFDLPSGKHQFNFQLQLPHQLPSSFVGEHGQIQYEVLCTIDRPWRFNNVFKQPFCILSTLDLNTNPMYRQPVDRITSKSFSRFCCCGYGGNIVVKGYIPYSGFAPGQSIPVKVYIKNNSKIRCHEANIKLVQMVEYRSYSPYPKSNYVYHDITSNKFGSLEKFNEREFSCILRIPATPASSYESCKIIVISYFVNVELKTKGLHTNMHARLPVTIGMIPLFYGATVPQHAVRSQPSTSQSQTVFSGGSHAAAAPPSYEEAVLHGPGFVHHTEEDKHIKHVPFIPKYPVYYYSAELATAPADAHGGYPITGGNIGPIVLGTITAEPAETKQRY